MTPRLSVIIPTFNRGPALLRLLRQLADQTAAASDFEIIVVDDGSVIPVENLLRANPELTNVTVCRQKNAGAATARHTGALTANSDILLFVDDDMEVGRDFIEQHLAAHVGADRRVVLGRIERHPEAVMPLFERWHASMIEKLATDIRDGRVELRGSHLFTGNASMRLCDYLEVGGFDPAMGHSEDVELGLRLEKSGCEFVFAEKAVSLHRSEHQRLDGWLRRAFLYGQFDHRIGRKHPELPHANPWRLLNELHPLSRAALLFSVVAPGASEKLVEVGTSVCDWFARRGAERIAMAGMSAAFTMQYFRGVRTELGSVRAAATDAQKYFAR